MHQIAKQSSVSFETIINHKSKYSVLSYHVIFELSCQESLKRSCRAIGIERMTPCDLPFWQLREMSSKTKDLSLTLEAGRHYECTVTYMMLLMTSLKF